MALGVIGSLNSHLLEQGRERAGYRRIRLLLVGRRRLGHVSLAGKSLYLHNYCVCCGRVARNGGQVRMG